VGATSLILVRHGESTANIAASAAEAARAEVIDVPLRDADVPLSEIGLEQAAAVGSWLRSLPEDAYPEFVWSSPYLRAADTARVATTPVITPATPATPATGAQPLAPVAYSDERLRDRELGITDALTSLGVEARLPVEAARKRRLGKFYYRPPGGESWADVVLRARSFLGDLDRVADGGRVLVVTHDAVILLLRYVCEALNEAQVLEIARTSPLLNASISILSRPSGTGRWTVDAYNSVTHLEQLGAPVTVHTGDTDVLPR
jgi:broad specificity phosphatase PhoE